MFGNTGIFQWQRLQADDKPLQTDNWILRRSEVLHKTSLVHAVTVADLLCE